MRIGLITGLGSMESDVATKDNRRANLSSYQARALRDYERILETTGLNPERVLRLVVEDPEAIVPDLKSMTDQAVRSEVIFQYTMIDALLDFILLRHFFGKKLRAARRTRRYKTLSLILQNIYVLQKLAVVRSFKDLPKAIVGKIAAINDLRNGLAHTFLVSDLKAPKRTYKGHSIFTRRGLEAFCEDARELRYFFIKKLVE